MIKEVCFFFNMCASGELCFKHSLLWSPWANVAISDKLDIYDTLLPGAGRKSLSHLFITAFTSCERNSSRFTFTPLHTQSMERCLFRTREAGIWKLVPVALYRWPHCYESKGTVLTAITVIVPHPGPAIHSSQSFHGFHNCSRRFSLLTSASYMVSAFIEVGIIIIVLSPVYWLVIVCIH